MIHIYYKTLCTQNIHILGKSKQIKISVYFNQFTNLSNLITQCEEIATPEYNILIGKTNQLKLDAFNNTIKKEDIDYIEIAERFSCRMYILSDENDAILGMSHVTLDNKQEIKNFHAIKSAIKENIHVTDDEKFDRYTNLTIKNANNYSQSHFGSNVEKSLFTTYPALLNFCIKPEFQRKRLGTLLLKNIISTEKQNLSIIVDTNDTHHQKNIKFYKKNGAKYKGKFSQKIIKEEISDKNNPKFFEVLQLDYHNN